MLFVGKLLAADQFAHAHLDIVEIPWLAVLELNVWITQSAVAIKHVVMEIVLIPVLVHVVSMQIAKLEITYQFAHA